MQSKWFEKLEKNTRGEDWIIGDIHGQFDLLQESLNYINFDKNKDRLISVGDLTDRGPKVFECLRLLREPWFFAVKGNHENMFVSKFGKAGYLHPLDLLRAYLYGDSQTIKAGVSVSELKELIGLIKKMPLILHVDHETSPFWIVHAQRPMRKNKLWTDEEIMAKTKVGFYDKDVMKVTWNRKILKELGKKNHLPKNSVSPIPGFEIITSLDEYQNLEKDVGLTYAGHTILEKPIMHRSHVFIDGGYYKGGVLRLVNHNLFSANMI